MPFASAGQMLGELDSNSTLRQRLRIYAQPDGLVIDEVGYLSYLNRHADLLFELISRRYQNRSTIVATIVPLRSSRSSPTCLRGDSGRSADAQRRSDRCRRRIVPTQGRRANATKRAHGNAEPRRPCVKGAAH